MSWSITVSGSQEVVQRELADALLLLEKALDWVVNAESETLSVCLNGYVSWAESGEITSSSVGFSVSESYPAPPETETQLA